MEYYYVNKNAQPTGEHEVHKSGCKWMPSEKINLGQFSNCKDAVEKAKTYYSNVDGGAHCCSSCHTR